MMLSWESGQWMRRRVWAMNRAPKSLYDPEGPWKSSRAYIPLLSGSGIKGSVEVDGFGHYLLQVGSGNVFAKRVLATT